MAPNRSQKRPYTIPCEGAKGRRAISNSGLTLLNSCADRPFGTFLLHTSSGSMMCHEPAEALQMLYVTMIKQSTAVDTRALDVVEEHFGDSYQVLHSTPFYSGTDSFLK